MAPRIPRSAGGRQGHRVSGWPYTTRRLTHMTPHNARQPRFASNASISTDTAPTIAVVIPCYNEEAAIARVISDFRRELPDALIYVSDNNSADRTAEIARASGALVSF